MTIVRFNEANEFIEELRKEFGPKGETGGLPSRPEGTILRLTCLFSSIPNLAPVRNVSVVATIKDRRGDIVRMERYCGQMWGVGAQDQATQDKTEEVRHQIAEAAQELGLEVRAGTFEGD